MPKMTDDEWAKMDTNGDKMMSPEEYNQNGRQVASIAEKSVRRSGGGPFYIFGPSTGPRYTARAYRRNIKVTAWPCRINRGHARVAVFQCLGLRQETQRYIGLFLEAGSSCGLGWQTLRAFVISN